MARGMCIPTLRRGRGPFVSTPSPSRAQVKVLRQHDEDEALVGCATWAVQRMPF